MILNEVKSESGISIISLVLTIILLLIILGASISSTSNDKLLQKADLAVSAYTEKSIREKVEFKIINLNIDKANTESGKVTLQDVLNLKNSDSEITDAYQLEDKVVLVVNNEYKCEVNENLEVESIEEYIGENESQLLEVERKITVDTLDMFEREENN